MKDFISPFVIKRETKPYILFNKDLKIVIVELSKLNKSLANLFDFKELLCYFLRESGKLTREDREYLSRHKDMEEIVGHFDKLSQEEKMQQLALDRWRNETFNYLDRSNAFHKGKQEGREDLILKMLEKGCSVFEVSKMTGLSESEIEKIKNKL